MYNYAVFGQSGSLEVGIFMLPQTSNCNASCLSDAPSLIMWYLTVVIVSCSVASTWWSDNARLVQWQCFRVVIRGLVPDPDRWSKVLPILLGRKCIFSACARSRCFLLHHGSGKQQALDSSPFSAGLVADFTQAPTPTMSLAASTGSSLGQRCRAAGRSSRHRHTCRPIQAALWTPGHERSPGQERPKGYDRPWIEANGGQPILAPRTADMAGACGAPRQQLAQVISRSSSAFTYLALFVSLDIIKSNRLGSRHHRSHVCALLCCHLRCAAWALGGGFVVQMGKRCSCMCRAQQRTTCSVLKTTAPTSASENKTVLH